MQGIEVTFYWPNENQAYVYGHYLVPGTTTYQNYTHQQSLSLLQRGIASVFNTMGQELKDYLIDNFYPFYTETDMQNVILQSVVELAS